MPVDAITQRARALRKSNAGSSIGSQQAKNVFVILALVPAFLWILLEAPFHNPDQWLDERGLRFTEAGDSDARALALQHYEASGLSARDAAALAYATTQNRFTLSNTTTLIIKGYLVLAQGATILSAETNGTLLDSNSNSPLSAGYARCTANMLPAVWVAHLAPFGNASVLYMKEDSPATRNLYAACDDTTPVADAQVSCIDSLGVAKTSNVTSTNVLLLSEYSTSCGSDDGWTAPTIADGCVRMRMSCYTGIAAPGGNVTSSVVVVSSTV